MVVANAGNAAADEAHLKKLAKDFDVTVTPLDRVFLAIQGPEAADVLLRAGIETDVLDLHARPGTSGTTGSSAAPATPARTVSRSACRKRTPARW